MFKRLSNQLEVDYEKKQLIDKILHTIILKEDRLECCEMADYYSNKLYQSKYCPKCHKKYQDNENFCSYCLIRLKKIDDIIRIKDIKAKQAFEVKGDNTYKTFEEIFIHENMEKIKNFNFTLNDYNKIIKNIKIAALNEFDDLVKSNGLILDYLNITDKILLFTKSFVEVDYKSHGQELGEFEFNKINIDDRQTEGLQITTLIHELSHFLLKEILSHILCKLLDCSKNPIIESISVFSLSNLPLTRLIDEYCAHTVEGRFAVYGYQDYSSFIQIQSSLKDRMPDDEIEIAKSIGNTLSLSIKDILESYVDDELREDIKDQFLDDVCHGPNYKMLAYENCNQLNDNGFIQAIWLILSEGFEIAITSIEKLELYEKSF